MKDIVDYTDLQVLNKEYDELRLERISWVDCLYIDNDKRIAALFEVENSTNFTSALIRASNVEKAIPKWMIIPDDRESELLSCSDPGFREIFTSENWSYLTYTEVIRLSSMRNCSLNDLVQMSHRMQ